MATAAATVRRWLTGSAPARKRPFSWPGAPSRPEEPRSRSQAVMSGVFAVIVVTRQPAARRIPAGTSVSSAWPSAARRLVQVDTASSSAMRRPGVPASRSQPAGFLRRQPPGHDHEQPAGAAVREVHAAGQPGPAGLLDDGQRVEQRILEGARRGGGPGVGDQLPVDPAAGQVDADGRDGARRVLERGARPGAAVRPGPGVEQQDRPVPPALFLPPDHEFAVPGGGPPVHPAQLVPVPVRARG